MQHRPVIYLAFANDRQDASRYLRNLPQERKAITEPLQKAEEAGLCTLVVTTNTTVDELLDTFQKYRNEIALFHFGGHAGEVQLFMEDVQGRPALAHASGLAEFLGQQQGLKLIFFNGCSTQPQVEELLAAGVPMVIATSQEIPDDLATALSTRFYTAISQGTNVGTAFNESVAAVKTSHAGSNAATRGERGDHNTVEVDRWPWDLYINKGEDIAQEWNLPEAANDPLYALPALPEKPLPPKPYRHLKWFTPNEAELFFGRGREIRDLYARITDPSGAPIILFYGASGVGKSSLLAAGLQPRLAQSHEVLYLRRDAEAGLSGTLQESLIEHARPQNEAEEHALPISDHARALQEALESSEHERIHEELADLESALLELKSKLNTPRAATSIADAWQLREQATGRPLVVLLDQVEETFTRQSPVLAQKELEAFLEELVAIFKTGGTLPRGRLILSFRKEWSPDLIARFEEEGLFFTRVFLERLSKRGIIEAIRGVSVTRRLQQKYNLTIDEQVGENHNLANEIAEDLLADNDSPLAPTLQILLTKMWEAATQEAPETPTFNQKLYHTLKGQGILLNDFLNEQLNALQVWKQDVVARGLALDLLVFHTTPLGTAQRRSLQELDTAYAHQQDELHELIDACENKYLLVTTTSTNENGEKRSSTRLAHDTLAPLVRRKFDESDAPGQRALRIIKNKAVAWSEGRKGDPLDGPDLKTVESGRQGMRVWNADETRMIEVSQKKRRARQIIYRSLLTFMGLFIITIAAVSYLAHQRGIEAQQNASRAHIQAAMYQSMTTESLPEAALWGIQTTRIEANSDKLQRALSLVLYRNRALSPFQVAHLAGHSDEVYSVAFSPNDSLIASGAANGTIFLWNRMDGIVIDSLIGHTERVNALAFSPDGRVLASASDDSTVHLWHIATPQIDTTLTLNDKVYDVAFNPAGDSLAIANGSYGIHMFDTNTQTFASKNWALAEKNAWGVTFSHDGRHLASTFMDKTFLIKDLEGDSILHRLAGHTKNVKYVTYSPDDSLLASIARDSTVRLWDAQTGALLRTTTDSVSATGPVRFNHDGSLLAYSRTDNTLRLQKVDNHSSYAILEGHIHDIEDLAFSNDGQHIVSASMDRTVKLWKTIPVLEKARLAGQSGGVNAVSFHPDGKKLASATDGYIVQLWDLETNTLIDADTHRTSKVSDVTFNPKGTILASASKNIRLTRLTRANTLDTLKTLRGKGVYFNSIAFSPDGDVLVSGSDDGLVIRWDVQSGTPKDTLIGHTDEVMRVTYSPDGAFLASGSDDDTIPNLGCPHRST